MADSQTQMMLLMISMKKLEENCVDYLEFLDDNALSKSGDVSLIAAILNSIQQLIIA